MALRRAAALLCFLASVAFPQAQVNSGDIKGTLTDATGGLVAKATVTASDATRGITRSTQSGNEGEYRIPLLPPGTYEVRVEASGFSPRTVQGVEVRVGDTVVLPLQLTVGAVATEVSVTADVPTVDVERTQQANTVQSVQIRNLPINRRNYLDLALLTPGVVETTTLVDGTDFRVAQAPQSGLSFGGSNGRGNMFTLDGGENYINSGGVRPSISQEAVAEFQVNRNSFAAEFGGGYGGAVNIVSRSGTNEVHGNVFGFLRHRSIQARNFFDPGKSAFTRSQAGATLGAPLKKDRTFVFAAFERLDRQETVFVPILQDRSAFGRLTASQQQLVDFFNASGVAQLRGLAQAAQQNLVTGNFPRTLALFNQNSGRFPYGEDTSLFSTRGDHRFSDRHSAFARFNLSRSFSENAQTGALLGYNRGRNVTFNDATILVDDTFIVSERMVSDTRLLFNHNTIDVATVDPLGPQIDITGFGLFGREIFLPSKTREWHWQAQQTFSYATGRHNLKFGGDVNPVRDNVRSETFFSGRFSFGENVPLGLLLNNLTRDPNFATTLAGTLTQLGQSRLVPNLQAPISALQAYNLGLPTFYQQGFGDPNWIGWSKRFNLFAQDNWRLHPRLTLNYGVRYELEVNEPVVGTDPNNLAPRVGLAWTPFESGRTVVRAGYGLFYSQNNLQIANVADTLSGAQINQVFVPLSGVPGINNALTGLPLTSSDIYQRLLGQGILGSRPIRREDLSQFGLSPRPGLPFEVKFGIVDDWRNPYAQQASFEVEQGIGSYAVSAAYNFNRGARIPRILNRNLRYGAPRSVPGLGPQPTYTFVNPLLFQNNVFEPTANSFYHGLMLQVSRRFSRHYALNAHYTFSKAIDEVTDFNTDFAPHDQLNARADRALSPFHQAHRFVLTGVFESAAKSPLLRGFVLAPSVVASSGRPFNILAGVDNLGDRTVNTHRPLGAGRNIGKGPDLTTVDLRVSRRFAFSDDSRRHVEVLAEGFNLLNRTNFRTVNNVLGNVTVNDLPMPLVGRRGVPTEPLSFTSAFDPRQFQVAVKVNF